MELIDIAKDEKKQKTLLDKINLFSDLKPEERKKFIAKFLPSLGLVTYEEIENMLGFLKKHGVFIQHARDVNEVTNLISQVRGGFAILDDVKATGIYQQDPDYLSKNALEIASRIKLCQSKNIEYLNKDGSYKHFLFDEKEFNRVQAESQSFSAHVTPIASPIEESSVNLNNADFITRLNKELDSKESDDFRPMHSDDLDDLNRQIGSLNTERKNLENFDPEVIGITDLFTDDWSNVVPIDGEEMKRTRGAA